MAAGAILTGTTSKMAYGPTPTDVDHGGKWTVTPKTSATKKLATSSTAGWREAFLGPKEWDATAMIMLHAGGAMPLTLGQEVAMEFHIDSGGADYYSGTVKVAEFGDIVFDPDSEEPVGQELKLAGHGALVANGTILSI